MIVLHFVPPLTVNAMSALIVSFFFVSGFLFFKMDKTDPSCFQPPYMKDNPDFWDPYVTGTENLERMFAFREFWDCELDPSWAGETITRYVWKENKLEYYQKLQKQFRKDWDEVSVNDSKNSFKSL